MCNMTDCKIKENKTICNCSYSCNNKGMCCKCLNYHIQNREFPACFFPDDIEKTYDRSINNFIKIYQIKKHL